MGESVDVPSGEALDMPSWAEIDLGGGSALPRVVSSGYEDAADGLAKRKLTAFNSHCPEHNPASPVH